MTGSDEPNVTPPPVIQSPVQGRNHTVRRDYAEASDATLVVAIGRYQQAALAEAYRRHAGAVFGLARRVLNGSEHAEEITQEIFVRLWHDPGRFDPERGSLRSFLLADTHGRAVDLLRSEVARRKREEREAQQTAESGYDLAHEVWDLALAGHVRDALARLNDGEREAIELAYFGGLTYQQAAAQLGAPEGTVKSRIRSGLKRLRTELADVGVTTGTL